MTSKNPYDKLYIYLLDGTLSGSDETKLGNDLVGNWVEERSSFLFFSKPADELIAGLLKGRPDLRFEDQYFFTYEDWQGGGLEILKIGPFVVVPPWLDEPEIEKPFKILLDPGVVFGNCLHPTTKTCLEALAMLARQDELGRVLDLGTGTGILALAAALLGAKSVLAVDLNPLCVKTADRNIKLNGLQSRVRAFQGKAEDFSKEPSDLVIANIHHQVVTDFLNRRARHSPEKLIISGQMRSETRDLKMQLDRLGYGFVKEWDHDMTWFTVLTQKTP